MIAPLAARPRRAPWPLLSVLALSVAPVLLGHAPAAAQETYPSRQLRMVVPFSVGGTSDGAE